ncbi:MAG TPA: GYF domain-containing protein, partial [Myxococcaceae bacterium]|nr:GYF domain-containing protein [Myxococcaceae bacterium]
MRFACDSCRAQYHIADEKVGERGVKVRCKKCGHVIHVRRPEAEAEGAVAGLQEAEPPAAPPGETPTAENSIFSGVDEDEIGAAFDQALGGEGTAVTNPFQPSDTDSTRVMDEEAVKRFAEMSQGTPTPIPPPPAVGVSYEWFVAVDEVQTGPLTDGRVKELWDRGEIGPDSLTWRQGLADWIPLSEVTELAALLAPRPSRPIFSPSQAATPVAPSVMTVPVESAFSAGGVTRTVRAEVPVATASPDTGFRPAASAALASLVKDEIEALNKPPPPKEPPPPAAPKQLLEVPEEPVKRTGPSATAMPAARPGGNGAPTAPTPFAYRAPTGTSPAARRGLTLGLTALGVVVAGLVVVVGYQTFFRPPAVVSVAPPPP